MGWQNIGLMAKYWLNGKSMKQYAVNSLIVAK